MKNHSRPLRAALIAVLAVLAAAVPSVAQTLADPNDPVYRYLDLWEQRGYLAHLPPLRPYPVNLVVEALERVADRGSPGDAAVAVRLLGEIRGSFLPVALHAAATHELQAKSSAMRNRAGLDLSSTGELGSHLGYSVRGRLLLDAWSGGEVYPRWDAGYPATAELDVSSTGGRSMLPITIADTPVAGYGMLSGMVSFGSPSLYVQAGLVRSSFGPVQDSPVLGPQAPQAGQFAFTYRNPWLTYNLLFLELIAWNGVLPDGTVYLLKGSQGPLYPQKYLIMHTFGIHPLDWLDVDVFQSVVFGGRFSPSYLLPFPLYTQAHDGDWDNSFLGLNLKLNLPYGIRPTLLLYVDDLHVSRLLELNFDTNGNKVALQVGLSWVAPIAFPASVSLTYTAVTPFMYTHFATQPINYLQYVQFDSQLGSILPPNSDQWSLRVSATPLSWLTAELWGKRVRHGNGSDYGSGSADGDGSVWDDGRLSDGSIGFLDRSSFLKQTTLEKVLQIGIEARADFRYRALRATASAGYALEILDNRDLNPAAPREVNHIFSLGVSIGL